MLGKKTSFVEVTVLIVPKGKRCSTEKTGQITVIKKEN